MGKRLKVGIVILVVILCLGAVGLFLIFTNSKKESQLPFSWDNATVYFALTDRFENGDSSNDHAYDRELDENGKVNENYLTEPGTFHGGDLKGLTNKIKEGYFTDLGVNAIWITPPYEQIHGYIGGDNFRFYSYHGYWLLDYTMVDGNLGNSEDLKEFIDTAHENGIRVIFDVVMNHVGYPNMKDMDEYGYGTLLDNWKEFYYSSSANANGNNYNKYIELTDAMAWSKWWGNDWIRSSGGQAGYEGTSNGNEVTQCLAGLPDVKTETVYEASLPPILETKWKQEGRYEEEMKELDEFFETSGLSKQVTSYQIKWLTDWVREYGVDGFRIDTAKHVEVETWAKLKEQAVIALKEWKEKNPNKKLDDEEFYMVGEVYGQAVQSKSKYFDNGFDALINFSFQIVPRNKNNIEKAYSKYSEILNNNQVGYLSYISSHDTALYYRKDLINGGTVMLLAPGAVQIYYGDETNRPMDFLDCGYADQKLRSDMNWDSVDESVLKHWQIVGQFRNRHISIGAGLHNMISQEPYIFSRTYSDKEIMDAVVVAMNVEGNQTINVSSVFKDGTKVRDAYTGTESKVENGVVTFSTGSNGLILVEEIK